MILCVCVCMCVCVHVCMTEYYSAIKKNEIMPFAATWMDPKIIILSKIRTRKTNTVWYHLYVESKIQHKWIYLWNRNRLTDIENRAVVANGIISFFFMAEWSHWVYTPNLHCPRVHQWTLRLPPRPGYSISKQCCREHGGACIFPKYIFLGVWAQEGDCWTKWALSS